jgi:predicted nucleic acid-binding Zn ribbon protein
MNPKKPRKKCPVCGEEAKRTQLTFCSNSCQMIHQNKIRYETQKKLWLSGKYQSIKKGMLKRLVREKFGDKCTKCGWNEVHPVHGNIPVELHHKDGDWRNNHPNNLDLLCPNCHALTPTYRALNKTPVYRGKNAQRKNWDR